MWPFSYQTIEVATFSLRGWCMLGVFLLPAFTRLGHECPFWVGSFESMWWNACAHRLDLGLYSHPKEFWRNGVRTHVNSKGKSHLPEKFSPEEYRTHVAASSRAASPTQYQRATPITCSGTTPSLPHYCDGHNQQNFSQCKDSCIAQMQTVEHHFTDKQFRRWKISSYSAWQHTSTKRRKWVADNYLPLTLICIQGASHV